MAAFQKFNKFTEDVWSGLHILGGSADVLKVYLTNATPLVTNSIKADIADIAAGNGYTAGGVDIQNTLSRTAGVTSLLAVDVVFTASGGNIGPFRYAVVYNDTSATDLLVGFADYGSAVTLANTETFSVDFSTPLATLT